MTGPSSSPRGEHTPRPGTTWEQHLVRTEQLVDDPDDTTTPGLNDPPPPRSPAIAIRRVNRTEGPS